MNRIIETFSGFKTEEYLPGKWVQRVWTLNAFTSYVPFPSEYDVYLEEISISTLLNDFGDALRDWFHLSGLSLKQLLENDSSYTDISSVSESHMSWQVLMNEGIDYKPIICIISTLILRFLDDPSNSIYCIEALLAIRLYSYLIAIPGSHICQIFNSTLYSHVVSVIKTCCEQIDSDALAKSKGVKRKSGEHEYGVENDDSGTNRLSCDKTTLISLIGDFLSNMRLVFENKKLKMDESSLNLTIQILIIITRLEKVHTALLTNSVNSCRKETVSHLAFKSFMILLSLSGSVRNNPSESAKIIVKSMLPMFLITELRTLGMGLKDASTVRTNYTCFLKMLLDKLGENAFGAINILVQRICVAVPDRAEMRMKASGIVLDVLKISPPDLQAEEIYSIVFMSHMAETKIRVFTLEIISKLLLEADAISMTHLPQKYAAVTNDEFLLAVILYRCQDVATSIRTKALSYFDQLISSASTNKRAKKLVDKIIVEPYVLVDDPEIVSDYHREIFDTHLFLSGERFLDDRALNPLPGIKVILDMLVYFSQEDKVFIKKCAIQTLARIFLFSKKWIKKELLQVFLVGCDDSSVLVRKTMSQILTDLLLMYPDHEALITCWVEGVTPMIAEEEIKAQEKVIEHYSKVILNNIMFHAHTTSVVSRLPWLVTKEILKQDKRSYLHFAAGKWAQANAVKNKTIQMIYSHVNTENNDVSWFLLVSFAQFMNLPNCDTVYKYYQRILPELDAVPHSQLVLETLYYVCPNLSKEDKQELFHQLERNLIDCTLPLKLIARSRDICEQILCTMGGKKGNNHTAIIEWSAPKIKACLQSIECQIGSNSVSDIENAEKLIKHIFMLGECAQAAPKCVSQNDIRLLQNVLLSPKKREGDAWKGRASNAVKAVTILTLVKLVLQKEETANAIMPVFREILSSSSVDSTIQVNTIVGMCDLCSRYTTLVERYFTYICKCFNSQHVIVRKTALICVIKRIKEEYVKLRPFILFPILTMTLDQSVLIQRIIAAFVSNDLRKRNNILETFYTGLFYFLNNSKEHSSTVKIPEDLRVMFSYTDEPEKREYIYIYVLDKLADTTRRLLICKKIVNDIMACVADDVLKMDEKTENILTDAFNVLIDNEKKISEAITKSKKSNIEDADDIEEMTDGNREQKKSSQAHGVVTVNEGLRLNEASEIIPIIIKLRQHLKKHRSRCLNSLMAYMCELMKNFRNEMTDLLGSEGELKAEIEYTLRQMEQEEERKRQETNEANEAAESTEINEARSEDENRNLPVITTSPEEICEQLQNLIVQLSRCDENIRSTESTDDESLDEPIIKLTKCDAATLVTANEIPSDTSKIFTTNTQDTNSLSTSFIKLGTVDEKSFHHEASRKKLTTREKLPTIKSPGAKCKSAHQTLAALASSSIQTKSNKLSPIKSPRRTLELATTLASTESQPPHLRRTLLEKRNQSFTKQGSVSIEVGHSGIIYQNSDNDEMLFENAPLKKTAVKSSKKVTASVKGTGLLQQNTLGTEKSMWNDEISSELEDVQTQSGLDEVMINAGVEREEGPEEIGTEKFSSDED